MNNTIVTGIFTPQYSPYLQIRERDALAGWVARYRQEGYEIRSYHWIYQSFVIRMDKIGQNSRTCKSL